MVLELLFIFLVLEIGLKKKFIEILKKINIKESIASTKEEYVQIAVKLAQDNDFRNSIINKIVKNKNKLFNDNKPIKFLEEVIRKKLLQLTNRPETRGGIR